MAIRIPVVFINGQWEMRTGGMLPVMDGAAAEIIIDPNEITDDSILAAVTEKRWVRILDAGSPLCVTLSPATSLGDSLFRFFEPPGSIMHASLSKSSIHSRFIKIRLAAPTEQQKKRKESAGGLWLKMEGMNDRGVESSTVSLPPIPGLKGTAVSLNHAFTLLSEVFETHRISHTGNIYEHVLYQDTDGIWYPLKELRNREMITAERRVIRELWERVINQLPSRLS